jgi:hypothetical protein
MRSNVIFVSYRRSDSAWGTDRVVDAVRTRFGREAVFVDASMDQGVDFRVSLQCAIDRSLLGLVVIGAQWLDPGKPLGQRRIDQIDDWVRFEVSQLLLVDRPVIPLLIDGASMPRPDQLPEGLKTLSYRQGIDLRREPFFSSDIKRLNDSIARLLPPEFQKAATSIDFSQLGM